MDLLGVPLSVIEDELVPEETLEELVVPHDRLERDRLLVGRENGGRHEGQGHEKVKDVVLVVLQVQPLLLVQRVDDLGELVLLALLGAHLGDEPRGLELLEGVVDGALGVRERGGDGHAAGGQEVEELVDDLQKVVAGQTPLVVAQKRRRHKREGGHHGDAADLADDLVADLAVEAPPLVGAHVLRGPVLCLQGGAHVDRLPDVEVDAPVALVEELAALDDRAGLLLLLLRAAQLLDVGLLLQHAVIADEDGNQGHVPVQLRAGLDHHGEHPVLGHDHLARPAAPPLDEELDGVAFPKHRPDVGLHHLPVDDVSAEGAADEEGAGLAEDVPEGPEHEVRPGGDEGQRDVVLVEDVGQQQVVDVAAVAGDDHAGHAPREIPDAGEPLPVEDDAVVDIVPEPGEGLVPELDVEIAVVRRDLLEVSPDLLLNRGQVPLRRCGVLLDEADQRRVIHRDPDDLVARLDPGPQGGALLPVDPADQFGPHPACDLLHGPAARLLQDAGQVDRLCGDDGGPVLVPDEGDESPERPRVLLVPEEDVHQRPLLPLPARSVGDGHGDDGDGDAEGLLRGQELDEGVGGVVALRAPQVDHGAAAKPGQAVENPRGVRFGGAALQKGADNPRSAAPERRAHAVAVQGLRDVHPSAQFVENEAVQAAGVLEGVDDDAPAGEFRDGALVLRGHLHPGEVPREKPVEEDLDLLPGLAAGSVRDDSRHAVGVRVHGPSGVNPPLRNRP
ncbi:MAG: hypothetical protein A4E67_01361 [Syntrophaceae bacterium PtaB.Bin038]|nr:MAG: hypothetical protein A4E67_01361 [Syntrophaceae bacterium PtaB.Bin038]